MKRSISLIFGFFFFVVTYTATAVAQKNTDSLFAIWSDPAQVDTTRLHALHYHTGTIISNNIDSGIALAQIQLEMAREMNDSWWQASALNYLGAGAYYQSRFDTAISYFENAAVLWEQVNNQNGLGRSFNNIAIISFITNDQEKAIDYWEKSADLARETGNIRGIAEPLSNMGTAHEFLGNYQRSIDLLEQALGIYEELNDAPGKSICLGALATVYQKTGRKYEALKKYKEILDILDEHENLQLRSTTILNMGNIYLGLGNTDSAFISHRKSLEITKRTGETGALEECYFALGSDYESQGDYSRAINFYLKTDSLASSSKNELEETAAKAQIASVYFEQGKYDSSLIYCNSVNTLSKNGTFRSAYRKSRKTEYKLNIISGNTANADTIIDELVTTRLKELKVNFLLFSEHDREAFFSTLSQDIDLYFDHQLNFTKNGNPGELLNYVLKVKGVLLKSSTASRNDILSSNNEPLKTDYQTWLKRKRQIVKAFGDGEDISELEKEVNQMEKELIKRSGIFENFEKIFQSDWKEVQAKLSEREVGIEMIRYAHQPNDFNGTEEFRYSAIIIKKNLPKPLVVPLFEESKLEKIIGSFPGNNLSYIEQVYGSESETKTQLYDLIWKPLEPSLKNVKKVYVSPVGLLHKIAFAALAKEQDVYLCDTYDIEMMSSTGNLATTESPALQMDAHYTIFGGIDYNSDSSNNEIWSYLDGSLSETEKIEKILSKANRDVGYYNLRNATEAQFKQTASESDILHIATHGFFYHDPDEVFNASVDEEESKSDLVFRGGDRGLGVNTFVESRNPLMRSGLVFAGANDVWSHQTIKGEDGVLTAAEVATIDMKNTDLVVLSACETGLGDIKGSEGVYGLQRSFKMAGVKYLIMSLWQVPDKETAEFMTTFYGSLAQSNDIRKAFHETQEKMSSKYDPYYWAAFVLVQ